MRIYAKSAVVCGFTNLSRDFLQQQLPRNHRCSQQFCFEMTLGRSNAQLSMDANHWYSPHIEIIKQLEV
ncbi:hypothetical protein GQ600_12121 [Phytophthora cactorum]|nr:hypothetical protein GQ600_12121 [Phytophthora cactorum]